MTGLTGTPNIHLSLTFDTPNSSRIPENVCFEPKVPSERLAVFRPCRPASNSPELKTSWSSASRSRNVSVRELPVCIVKLLRKLKISIFQLQVEEKNPSERPWMNRRTHVSSKSRIQLSSILELQQPNREDVSLVPQSCDRPEAVGMM